MGIDITFKSNLPEVLKKINDSAFERMDASVDVVRKTTLETLSGTRTGKTYRVPKTKRTYTASAPGEPPAQATSGLRQSIKGTVSNEGKLVVGRVGTNLKYGARLEFGFMETDSLGRRYNMAPRPWLRKSFEQSQAKVIEICSRVWF